MAALGHPDRPERLWSVRHGQSAGNVARNAAERVGAEPIDIHTRDADLPLSMLGKLQSQGLGHTARPIARARRLGIVGFLARGIAGAGSALPG